MILTFFCGEDLLKEYERCNGSDYYTNLRKELQKKDGGGVPKASEVCTSQVRTPIYAMEIDYLMEYRSGDTY